MAVAYTDVQALNPQFAALTEGRIDPFLASARRRVNQAYWGTLYDDGVLYLAAHLLAEAERSSGQAGPVTAMAAGAVSASFAAPASAAVPAHYASTQYGVTFYSLMKSLAFQATRAI